MVKIKKENKELDIRTILTLGIKSDDDFFILSFQKIRSS